MDDATEQQTVTPADVNPVGAGVVEPVKQKRPVRTRVVKTTSAQKTAAPTKAKTGPKPDVQAQSKGKAEKPKLVHVHRENKVEVKYAGDSEPLNANRKTSIMLKDGKVTASDRMRATLYALRQTYGGKGFPARGIDNGVLRDLHALGFVKLDGGQIVERNGHRYREDGAQPVVVHITAEGAKHGRA